MSENRELEEWYNVFLTQYKSIVNQDIKDWAKIEELVKFFAQSKLGCLVDFIDSSWWDHIETIEFDSSQKRIHVVYNTISSDLPEEDLSVLFSVFGAHRVCGDFFAESVRIVPVNGWPVLLMKTQYKEESELNRLYSAKCQKFKIHKYKTFSVEIDRICSENKEKKLERTVLPNVNCFTVAFFPKTFGRKITELDSERNLLKINKNEFWKFLTDDALSKIQELCDNNEDFEEIRDYGNRIRRNFESYLKVQRIKNDSFLRDGEKDCQKLMLGSLISELSVKELPDKFLKIEDIVKQMNEWSHDSGKDTSINDLIKVHLSLMYLINEERGVDAERELKEKGIIEDAEEREKKEIQKKKYDERKIFIINNARLWNFRKILRKKWFRRNIKFYFCLKENAYVFPGGNSPRFYLNKKGMLVQYSGDYMDKDIPLNECFYIYDREKVPAFLNCLRNKINGFLEENDFEPLGGMGYDVSVSFVMRKKARHLFTKMEVEQVIRNADDSVDNWLVINEYGRLCVVQTNQYLYPVRFEYRPRNCGCFGKLVSEKHLAEVYSFALSGYLSYLKTGTSEYVDFDYVGGSDEEKIKKIKELIEPNIFKIAKKFFYWVLTLFQLNKQDKK